MWAIAARKYTLGDWLTKTPVVLIAFPEFYVAIFVYVRFGLLLVMAVAWLGQPIMAYP
jgi:hypothetical protein